ncbi:hypothetical protein F1C10_06020 [Sphingomonas sp. NBWT7]|uniref:RcnB family protein n=1 Tax=Sphingomonas sp. NBWT7 TaxID=2596913 RepID=UPI001628EF6D|nr:RcnB family protein [Sphingomonas sp. NBWT7]QNE31532.1 hypothetical protein F1C10_06020 [Sphingomonas sp. NBWT7]
MGRKFVAALLAAVAIVPAMAVAQERGGDRGAWRAERAQQREAMRQQGGDRSGGWQRPAQGTGGQQRQAPTDGAWQQRREQRAARPDGARPDNPRAEAFRDFRQQRDADRRDFQSERQRDRQALIGGQVTRDQYRADRSRDLDAYRRDRQDDRQRLDRDRDAQFRDRTRLREQAQRGWDRSRADWADQDRWRGDRRSWDRGDLNRGGWGDQRRTYGRNDRFDRGGWNRDWRRDTRYDWSGWRARNRNAFRLPRYYAPYGWNAGYRSFGVGSILSQVLFAQNYWINDPWAYRLPDADGPYRWVRYYNDALLVDVYSGEVVDVINNIFW